MSEFQFDEVRSDQFVPGAEATCDDCGATIPGLSAYEAGFGTLALCATCNHGTAVCGGNGVAWSSAPEEEANAYNVPPVLDHGGDTAQSVAAEMAARSVDCPQCGHAIHTEHQMCPEWMPEENAPACGCGYNRADQAADEAAAHETWEREEMRRCSKCSGTGIYSWGGTINGKPVKSGMCFACRGKGRQDRSDLKRNDVYWNEYATIAL